MSLSSRLIKNAQIEPLDEDDGALDQIEVRARELFRALETIFIQKGRLYGNHRFDMPTTPKDYYSKMLFADIERKFKRYSHFTWHETPGADLVQETLADLVVHSIVAMLVIEERRMT